jgi:Domain of unknown function (DUF4336)
MKKQQRQTERSAPSMGSAHVFFAWICLLSTASRQRGGVQAFDAPTVFPVSVRQALAEKAKQVNNPVVSGRPYAAPGWSNRAGTILTPQYLNPGIYTADRPFLWNNIDVGCRCTIVELPNRSKDGKPDLWVHSPVGLDGPTIQALGLLGNVKYVVSPNYEHVKFAPQWYQTYPECEMWACPGLSERMPQVKWTAEIPEGCRPPGYKGSGMDQNPNISWDTSLIQPLHINVEVNPFTGKSFFNEVIYYHRDSKTLIVTDLYWNYPASVVPNSEHGANDAWELAPTVDEIPLGSRLWKFGMDQVYAPFYSNFMVQDKAEYKSIVDHIVNVWDIEMVVPAHGDILRGKDFVRKVLSRHFGLEYDTPEPYL